MQGTWLLILDDKFVEAYEHGILVECGDGITRREFIRFFTYTTDYVERYVQTLVASYAEYLISVLE